MNRNNAPAQLSPLGCFIVVWEPPKCSRLRTYRDRFEVNVFELVPHPCYQSCSLHHSEIYSPVGGERFMGPHGSFHDEISWMSKRMYLSAGHRETEGRTHSCMYTQQQICSCIHINTNRSSTFSYTVQMLQQDTCIQALACALTRESLQVSVQTTGMYDMINCKKKQNKKLLDENWIQWPLKILYTKYHVLWFVCPSFSLFLFLPQASGFSSYFLSLSVFH